MATLQERLKAQTLLATQVDRVTKNALQGGVSSADVVEILQEISNGIDVDHMVVTAEGDQ